MRRFDDGSSPVWQTRPTIRGQVVCVDLDGTFLRTDTLYECLIKAAKLHPAIFLRFPVWLLRGRVHFKGALAKAIDGDLDLESCPRNVEVEELVREARAAGKRIELVTAAHEELISRSPFLRGVFDSVVGSGDTNLKGEAKAKLLNARHPDGFAYIGNSTADLPVWRVATERFGINVPNLVRRRAQAEGLDLVEIGQGRSVWSGLLSSMRLHQWAKNLLIFVSLALTLAHLDVALVARFVAGFILLGLLTSGTYLLNDVLDVEADRKHPRKRLRAIASGELPLPVAILASFVLILTALAAAPFVGTAFALTLAAYFTVTLCYSLFLKRMPLVDVLVIAGLFTLRIIAGMTLIDASPSEWLLMFAIFFFLSLALMKRLVELNVVVQAGEVKVLLGRGYSIDDTIFVTAFGIASGVASLVIFALFVSAMVVLPSSSYSAPVLLWGALPPLTLWIMRMWLATTRGDMHDDPIVYAVRDRASWILAGIASLFAVAAQLSAK